MNGRRVVIFLSRGDETSLRLAGSCALASASMGDRVDVFLFGPAVPAVVGAAPRPQAAAEPGEEAARLLHQARAAGSCRLFACSASLVEERVDPSAAEKALDAVVGWPTIIEWSRGVVDRFYF